MSNIYERVFNKPRETVNSKEIKKCSIADYGRLVMEENKKRNNGGSDVRSH
jgi:hypothetical protein